MDKIDLTKFYPLQKDLDQDIADRHGVTYASTHEKRLLALIVELGELANETRCFKYWSTKPMSEKAIVLDEFADGLHFFLSLGIPLNVHKMVYDIVDDGVDLTNHFHLVYKLVVKMADEYTEDNYVAAFQEFINIIAKLGYNSKDIEVSYLSKLDVNYKRQINKY